jgi:hypothetical protein
LPGAEGRSASELARRPGRGARSAQRHVKIAQETRLVLARNHRAEHLADAAVSRMSSRAEAQAGPAPQDRFSALDHCPDLRTVRHLRDRIEGRAYALKPISYSLPDSPAGLCQDVGKLGISVFAHNRILSPAKTLSQGPGYVTRVQHRHPLAFGAPDAHSGADRERPGHAFLRVPGDRAQVPVGPRRGGGEAGQRRPR